MVKNAEAKLTEPSSGSYYSGTDFWIKLKHSAKSAGYELVEKSLWLYYAARHKDTPPWAKAVIYSALAYFILPTDAVPDFIPVTGYTDDMAAIAAAVTTIASYINDDVKAKGNQKLSHWFD